MYDPLQYLIDPDIRAHNLSFKRFLIHLYTQNPIGIERTRLLSDRHAPAAAETVKPCG